jgi:hypothetical protein
MRYYFSHCKLHFDQPLTPKLSSKIPHLQLCCSLVVLTRLPTPQRRACHVGSSSNPLGPLYSVHASKLPPYGVQHTILLTAPSPRTTFLGFPKAAATQLAAARLHLGAALTPNTSSNRKRIYGRYAVSRHIETSQNGKIFRFVSFPKDWPTQLQHCRGTERSLRGLCLERLPSRTTTESCRVGDWLLDSCAREIIVG